MIDQLRDLLKDPLYRAVITAQNEEEAKKALKTLKSIRGGDAVNVVTQAIKNNREAKK